MVHWSILEPHRGEAALAQMMEAAAKEKVQLAKHAAAMEAATTLAQAGDSPFPPYSARRLFRSEGLQLYRGVALPTAHLYG